MTKKLTTYRKKRQFSKTPEPVGSEKPAKKSNDGVFVIHKHDASHLHYDLRLEIDGVLKSWAVPKGPSTDPSVKRLAVETEDHPMEYLKFEGTIPQGQYGGGTVMVWDIGRFSNIREKKDKPVSLAQSYQDGTIEVTLHGKKLQGNYALVHTHFGKNDKNWLLIKMRDKFAEKKIKNVTKSAITGRTMKQIAQEE
jgi:DNA ligase D-like protein (predicted 3'-phosphoesterase)